MASTYDFTQGGRYPFFDVLLKTVPELHHPRLAKYKTFWDMYAGAHWGSQQRAEDGITRNTYNYCKVFVEKIASFLVSKGVMFRAKQLGVAVDETNEAALKAATLREQAAVAFLQNVWTVQNNKPIILNELAKSGGITGDAFMQVAWRSLDETDTELPKELQGVQLTVVPSEFCFPLYDIIDRSKLIQLTFIYPKLEVVTGDSRAKVTTLRVVYTKDKIVTYKDGAILSSEDNLLGEIPFVHIPNYLNPGSHFGVSDLDAIHELNVEFNKKMSELSDIIAYSIAPITIIKGAKASSITKASKKVWSGLPADADVFNLELKSDFAAMYNYVSAVKTAMHEIGKIPESVLGKEAAISNTTGIALQTMYQPLMDLIVEKRTLYGEGLNRINRMILKYYEIVGTLPEALKGFKFQFDTVFADPLPKDRQMTLDELGKETALGLESRVGGMARLGSENPQEKLSEIRKEQLDEAKHESEIAKITGILPGQKGTASEKFNQQVDRSAKQNAAQNQI